MEILLKKLVWPALAAEANFRNICLLGTDNKGLKKICHACMPKYAETFSSDATTACATNCYPTAAKPRCRPLLHSRLSPQTTQRRRSHCSAGAPTR